MRGAGLERVCKRNKYQDTHETSAATPSLANGTPWRVSALAKAFGQGELAPVPTSGAHGLACLSPRRALRGAGALLGRRTCMQVGATAGTAGARGARRPSLPRGRAGGSRPRAMHHPPLLRLADGTTSRKGPEHDLDQAIPGRFNRSGDMRCDRRLGRLATRRLPSWPHTHTHTGSLAMWPEANCPPGQGANAKRHPRSRQVRDIMVSGAQPPPGH